MKRAGTLIFPIISFARRMLRLALREHPRGRINARGS
jgi:hypothetical protein